LGTHIHATFRALTSSSAGVLVPSSHELFDHDLGGGDRSANRPAGDDIRDDGVERSCDDLRAVVPVMRVCARPDARKS
jgi:hypothetical protein